MKKFYNLASSKLTDDGYLIQLDGKPVQTPLKQDLIAPTKGLADVIVLEWAAQGDSIQPDTMPVTQLLITAIDKIREREKITKALMKFLDTDLICYWTGQPEALAKKQKELWGRWTRWFDEHFEVPLLTTKKITALKQDEEAHKRVWNYIEALDDYYFTLLHVMTSLTGSIVIALAFCEGEIKPDEIFEVVKLEELYKGTLYNEEKYGAAPHEEKERHSLKAELYALQKFIDLVNID